MRSDDINRVRDPLQNLHLSTDDGAALDDKAALVASAKSAGVAPGEDRRRRPRVQHDPAMMTEARVGRLLAACLHQAILDQLPQRLEFYEHWLHSEGLRDGNIGLSPMIAVIGFLRTEGEAYDGVVARAGEVAAEWSIASLSGFKRRLILSLPRPLRLRAALGVAKGIVRSIFSATKASSGVRRREARLSINASLFCDVREQQRMALCGFYRGVAVRTLAAFGIPATGRVESCHAIAEGPCVIALELFGTQAASDPAMAA
jgi:hypothetical protein